MSHPAYNHIGWVADASELYLKGMDGFFLLDDPFTDMGATRRAAAVQAIGAFAENHQVLFFTCHPEHGGQMQSLPRAKNFQLRNDPPDRLPTPSSRMSSRASAGLPSH